MIEQENDTKKITVTYTDGSEKVIERGVCFSVHEVGGIIGLCCDGIAGSQEDCVAALAMVARIAKELGIPEDLVNKVEPVEDGANA